jgi:hypothetical protein
VIEELLSLEIEYIGPNWDTYVVLIFFVLLSLFFSYACGFTSLISGFVVVAAA